MGGYRLAVDIGASSGRVMAGKITEGNIDFFQVHRFENKLIIKNAQYCWDIKRLLHEIKKGIKKSVEMGLNPKSIGINTWAVDFVLLDEKDQLVTDTVSYRDPRTNGVMEAVIEDFGKSSLYERTGIAFQPFNTVYQLLALKKENPEALDKAKSFLMIPDYLHFLLTGKKHNEYTNATTTQLVNAFTKDWDFSLIEEFGLPKHLFRDLTMAGTNVGRLTKEIQQELGVELDVIIPATHDTASAIAALPEWETSIYISSGTWSLIGIENPFPICVTKAMEDNFTNEGGVQYRFRFLKNIMGLWMIQEVRRLLNNEWSFAELAEMSKSSCYDGIIDVNQQRFLKPANMIAEIKNACKELGFAEPKTAADLTRCIYQSLVDSYTKAIEQIESTVERTYDKIQVIGGGAENSELNQLLANRIGRTVAAGPTEATALGNYIIQAMTGGEIASLSDGRQLIKNSIAVNYYTPKGSGEYVNKI
ncbi:rhamnulokinase [Alkalihalobacillus sp. 1P02AB]|uniref:rhamnulokinase n=1 Tax=Alkalihalobacillus sp. 1P02AB TaxID=3132260 RepID=UPI0039A5054A